MVVYLQEEIYEGVNTIETSVSILKMLLEQK